MMERSYSGFVRKILVGKRRGPTEILEQMLMSDLDGLSLVGTVCLQIFIKGEKLSFSASLSTVLNFFCSFMCKKCIIGNDTNLDFVTN